MDIEMIFREPLMGIRRFEVNETCTVSEMIGLLGLLKQFSYACFLKILVALSMIR